MSLIWSVIIKGEYRDKNYLEWAPIAEETPVKPIEKQVEKPKKAPLGVKKEGKSYAEVGAWRSARRLEKETLGQAILLRTSLLQDAILSQV